MRGKKKKKKVFICFLRKIPHLGNLGKKKPTAKIQLFSEYKFVYCALKIVYRFPWCFIVHLFLCIVIIPTIPALSALT